MRLKAGDILTPKHQCSLWSDNMDDETDLLRPGDLLLVVSLSIHELGKWWQPRKIRLNHHLYRKVLTPRGVIGWVHQDNCDIFRLCIE